MRQMGKNNCEHVWHALRYHAEGEADGCSILGSASKYTQEVAGVVIQRIGRDQKEIHLPGRAHKNNNLKLCPPITTAAKSGSEPDEGWFSR